MPPAVRSSMPQFPASVAALFGDRERVARFLSVATSLASAASTDQLLKIVVRGARSLADADGATLRVLEPGSNGRLVWSGRGGSRRGVALQREIRVADRPYAALRVTTTRRAFAPVDVALVDLLCVHAGVAFENVALRSHEDVLQRISAAVHDLENPPQPDAVRRVGDLRIDLVRHEVLLADEVVHLTPSEYRLLELLTEEPGRTFTRHEIVSRLWNSEYVGNPRVADAHVARLRRKLQRGPRRPARLENVRGVGYKLVPLTD